MLSLWLEESNNHSYSKAWKGPVSHSRYHPVALTSCMSKTLSGSSNHTLHTNMQCGFMARWGTVEHLMCFKTFAREAFIHNQRMVSIFVEIEKGYDTTWKYMIWKDLHGFGLRVRLPHFIVQFFKDGSFMVCVRSIFSDPHSQGVHDTINSVSVPLSRPTLQCSDISMDWQGFVWLHR